ncbi:MAG: TonB-dependent receptor [Bacteroidales bacterium]
MIRFDTMLGRILTIVSILFMQLIYSTGFSDDNINPDGKIKGAVADKKSKEPVEYATVALYRTSDNTLIDGVITDHLGHFKINQPDTGSYYLLISFIGLKDIQTEVFEIEEAHDNINLGNFFFESSVNELEGVEIVAKRAPIEYKIDKKVITVDKQITSEAGTAVDVLESIPSVQVDVEGNVSLRGSTGFTVLIDGKPTILDPSDALRQIPSSSIENIEIITNPSVKYEPDGATGIINIITKKNRLDGLSGIANVNVGMHDQYGGDFQMNYRMNKLNIIFGANYNKRGRPGYSNNERTTHANDTIFFVESYGDSERGHTGSSIRGGLEYDISKNDFVSIAGTYGGWDMNSNSTLRYNESSDPIAELFSYNSFDDATRGGNYYSLDGVYQHTFNNKKPDNTVGRPDSLKNKVPKGDGEMNKPSAKHLLSFEINYRNRDFNESSMSELRELSDELIGGNKNVEKGPSESLHYKIDYTLPVGKLDKFEAGMQWRSGKSKDITELWLYNTATNELEQIDEYSYLTDYYRNIYAAYGLYAGYAGKFGYQLGLRTEYTDRKIKADTEDPFTINRWDYFPTIHVSYSMPADQQIMASYSRRIDRPRGWWLEPFITWVDAYNVRQGNPDLQPEYIDSYDAGYLKKFGENFFSLEAYYRITHNKVERISSVYDENVMMQKPENVGQDYSLGFEAMLNFQVLKWWDFELSGNYYNYKLEGELSYALGDEIIIDPINRSSRNWNSRLNNTFRVWKNGVLQINSRYNSASVTAQGTSSGYFTVDAAFRVSFLNRALSANLQARDLLGTELRENSSEGPGFYSYSKYDPKSPSVALTISYRFNNFKVSKRSGQNGGGDTEEF